MTVLNANSLAKSGTDILGEKLPIYFDTWLHGGQSPFATYLVAIMIKLFGYSLFVTRVPMFVFSMLGLVAFYKFLKEVIPENETLINITFCLACISPWLSLIHIFVWLWEHQLNSEGHNNYERPF